MPSPVYVDMCILFLNNDQLSEFETSISDDPLPNMSHNLMLDIRLVILVPK